MQLIVAGPDAGRVLYVDADGGVKAMLTEDRPPVRRDECGLLRQSHVHTISHLVQESLNESPNRALRTLTR